MCGLQLFAGGLDPQDDQQQHTIIATDDVCVLSAPGQLLQPHWRAWKLKLKMVTTKALPLMMCVFCLQLAESLKENTSIEALDIGGNNIGPEGIKVILSSLKGNNSLRTLELGYNPIGAEGAKALSDAVKYDLGVSILPIAARHLN